jgi:hypothetical protein
LRTSPHTTGALGNGRKAVGQHVARTHAIEHVAPPRRREIDVRHDRQRELLGDLDRELEREDAMSFAGVAPDAHLDADDQIAMLPGDLQAFAGVQQANVAGLTHHHGFGEREDAGERDVEIGQDADRRPLDHELAKAEKVARSGAARVDQGRGAGAPRH